VKHNFIFSASYELPFGQGRKYGTNFNPVMEGILGGWRLLARGIHTFPDRGRSLNDFVVRLFVPSPGAEDVIAGGVALEVMAVELQDGELYVIHAMELRDRYQLAYEEAKRWQR